MATPSDNDVVQNTIENQILHSFHSFDYVATKHLIKRIAQVAESKQIPQLGEKPITEWRQEKEKELGSIALLGLLAKTLWDMAEQGIQLIDVMCEDPTFLLECLKDNRIDDYIAKYPPISIEMETKSDENDLS